MSHDHIDTRDGWRETTGDKEPYRDQHALIEYDERGRVLRSWVAILSNTALQPGDEVICIDSTPLTWSKQALVAGETYIVREITDENGIRLDGGTVAWSADRFTLNRAAAREAQLDSDAAAPPARIRMTAGELSHPQLGHQVTFGVGSHLITATLEEVIQQVEQTRLVFSGIRPPKPNSVAMVLGVKEMTSFRLGPRETVLVDPRDEVEALAELVSDETPVATDEAQA
jgi:hypothetical protein